VTPDAPRGESIDQLLAQLRERITERRATGDYPDRLEEDLDTHFEHIAAHRYPSHDYATLRTKLYGLDVAGAFTPQEIRYDTRLPGGSLLHRLLGKLVRRQTEGVLAQAQRHADAVREVLWDVVTALESPAAHSHVDLVGEMEAIFERLATYERAQTGTPAIAALVRRVEALETAATNDFSPFYSSERFEEHFRGSSDDLRDRYRDLAALFNGATGPVVDIGCGRGEFLELLLALDVDARGIEIDDALVRDARDRDLPVEYGEAVAWLRTAPDATLGGLSLVQVVEHLGAQQLVDLVALAATKVRPGGRVVVETVNPQSLYTFAHAFYLDPTHHAPVHPAYLMFLFREAGFAQIDLQWRSPCPPDDRLQDITSDLASDSDADDALAKQVNANNERVNQLLFAEQDYALVATR
jgi:O-antigen chain-terminating methyltransferase